MSVPHKLHGHVFITQFQELIMVSSHFTRKQASAIVAVIFLAASAMADVLPPNWNSMSAAEKTKVQESRQRLARDREKRATGRDSDSATSASTGSHLSGGSPSDVSTTEPKGTASDPIAL